MIVVFPDHTHLYTIFVGVRSTVDIFQVLLYLIITLVT